MTVSSVNVESSADFKTILESAGAGIVQVDQRGRICYSNRRASKILGYSRAELNNRDFHSLVRCRGIRTETDLIDRCPLQDFLQGESSLDESLRLLTRKDGRSVAVEMTLAAVSEGHKRVGAVISLKDISRHANEQEVIAGSESRYRNFIQKFEGIAFRTTLDLKPIFFHGAIEEITGYSEKEFISQDLSWDQIIYPDDYNIFLERTRYVLMVPDAGRELQYRIVRKDGQIRWIAEYVQKVCDDEGQPLFVQGTMYDISDRKRAEMELREREKQLAEAQRIARMGNWMWDIKSGKVSWSDEVYRIFGCKPREFEPTLDRVQETIFEEDRQRLIETVENSIALNKAASLDHRILLPDGDTRTVHSQGEVIRDDDGRPVRMVGTIQDISERVEAEQEIRKLNEELEKRVAERTSKLMEEIEGREGIETALLDEKEKVQSILDNAGQGFLTFGRSLKIDLEYSEKCRTLFGGEIWGNTFPDLIYPNDEEQHEFLETILADIFSEIDHKKREIFISLLPQEVHVNKRIAHIEYKDFITPAENDEQKLLVIITDITENRELQDRIEKERNVLKMVVKAVTNYTELSESMRDYEIFVNAQMEMILDGEGPVEEMIDEIFRAFHTFKGTFSQLELINVVEKLHALESKITRLRSERPEMSIEEWRRMLSSMGLQKWLEADLEILKSHLGDKFFSRKAALIVEPSQIADIEQKMIATLTAGENKLLLPHLRRLRYKPFKELLGSYPEYVERLAERLQKLVNPVVIEGDDVLVDPDHYHEFVKSLIHVFRNSVDHGIETDEERFSAGKDEFGQIKCEIKPDKRTIELKISDDGRGLDINSVRAKAIEKGIFDENTIGDVPDEKIKELIFMDSISTRENPSEISGRGVGLSAVRSALDKLGGSVHVESIPGQGITCHFELPVIETIDLPEISIDKIIAPMVNRARELMTDEMEIGIVDSKCIEPEETDRLMIEDITALIGIKGALSGTFAMSFERDLAMTLVRKFAIDELSDEEAEEYVEDTMAEITNIVLGNTLNVFPEINNLVTIGTPKTVRINSSVLRFTGSDIWTATVMTEKGRLSVSLLVSDTM